MYKTFVYKVWCLIARLELKIRLHGERINAIRGPLNLEYRLLKQKGAGCNPAPSNLLVFQTRRLF